MIMACYDVAARSNARVAAQAGTSFGQTRSASEEDQGPQRSSRWSACRRTHRLLVGAMKRHASTCIRHCGVPGAWHPDALKILEGI